MFEDPRSKTIGDGPREPAATAAEGVIRVRVTLVVTPRVVAVVRRELEDVS